MAEWAGQGRKNRQALVARAGKKKKKQQNTREALAIWEEF